MIHILIIRKLQEEIVIEDKKSTPFYFENDQDVIYLRGQLKEKETTIRKLQSSYLFNENIYYKEQISRLNHEIMDLSEHIHSQDQFQNELLIQRNEMMEKRDLAELYYKDIQYQFNKEVKQNKLYISDINQKEKIVHELTIQVRQLQEKNEELQKEELLYKSENKKITEQNKELTKKNEALLSEIKAKNAHLKDLNRTLSKAEIYNKDIVEKLINKTAKLEGIFSEKEQLIIRLNEAKQELENAERVKLEFFKEVINSYKAQLEDHTWWISQQFADIDRSVSQQKEELDNISRDQEETSEKLLNVEKQFQNSTQLVEEKFNLLIMELDELTTCQEDISLTMTGLQKYINKQEERKNELKYKYSTVVNEQDSQH